MHLDRKIGEIRRELRDAKVGAIGVECDGSSLRMMLPNPERRAEIEQLLRDRFPSLVIGAGTGAGTEPNVIRLTLVRAKFSSCMRMLSTSRWRRFATASTSLAWPNRSFNGRERRRFSCSFPAFRSPNAQRP
jgi:hypothetical protein